MSIKSEKFQFEIFGRRTSSRKRLANEHGSNVRNELNTFASRQYAHISFV